MSRKSKANVFAVISLVAIALAVVTGVRASVAIEPKVIFVVLGVIDAAIIIVALLAGRRK